MQNLRGLKSICAGAIRFAAIATAGLSLFLAQAPPLIGQTTRDLKRPSDVKTVAAAEARTALVIGNSSYQNAPVLTNPVNDARDVSTALKELGFDVITGENLNADQMKAMVLDFGERLKKRKGVGLFFYAGHGVQINGRNYLIPVEAKALREQTIEFESLDVNRVLGEMDAAGSRLNMVILDACRNNPFERSWRSADQGLAEIRAPRGTLVAYATAPGKVAFDGNGRNGAFTSELLKLIRQPNMLVEVLFKRVGERVSAVSKGEQEPYLSSSLRGDFYFSSSASTAEVPVAEQAPVAEVAPVPAPAPTPAPEPTAEDFYWKEIAGKNTVAAFQQYLKDYPNGVYAEDAKRAIREVDSAIEKKAWDEAVQTNTVESYKAFLAKFPNGMMSSQAQTKVKSFERGGDVAKWQEVDGLKTVAAYEAYLLRYPEGEFARLARLRLKDLGIASPGSRLTKKNSIGIEFIWIPSGDFVMGSSEAEINQAWNFCRTILATCDRALWAVEGPQRSVTISRGFWLGKFEVTQGQWQAVMGTNPSKYSNCGADCPVEQVSWLDVQEFIAKLNAQDDGLLYSLPSEAEWEYAARAGTTTAFSFGDSLSSTQANFNGKYPYGNARKGPNVGKTVRVGSYQPNPWGIYDMNGNVSEWTQDIYSNSYPDGPLDGTANTVKGDTSARVLRGGSWIFGGHGVRSTVRFRDSASARGNLAGFRLAARPR